MEGLVADVMSNFWAGLGVKVLLVAIIAPTSALVFGILEMKISAHMQDRIGPYFVGAFGWIQLLADGLKFFQKEDIVPTDADKPMFKLAPVLVLMSSVAIFIVIPWGPGVVFGELDLGVFYVLALSSVSAVGIIVAGWSSANKYSLMGGLRAGGQLIAYELPLLLSVLNPVIMAGTMNLNGIVEAQVAFGAPFVVVQFVAFGIFMISALAELTRLPFDMPIAESELVMGYFTEYTGFRFLFFFIGEYAAMFGMMLFGATLFLGGYWAPGIPDSIMPLAGPVVLMVKAGFLVLVAIWFRWTWPRLREDQLQSLAWKWLIPLALLNIAVTATLKVVL
ncbi:MAG: NADH-quinone oxidoreductase subunit NuoH [Acidimicrobiia bacterium]|nr:NADH-quinone oxidoreductase subunit NuoH [Acidimicrobiia bacterium]